MKLMSIAVHKKPVFSPQCEAVVVQLVWTLRFRFPMGSLDFPLTMAVRSTKPLTEMGGKGDRCVGLTTLPFSCADCLQILGASNSCSSGRLARHVPVYVKHWLVWKRD